jgi:ABC-type dipeptide/oligopeptide/nickel transport system permease component
VAIGAVVMLQLLLYLAPGDPISTIPDGERLRPILEVRWGLDKSLPERMVDYAIRASTGDLGQSFVYRPGSSVWEVVASPAISTLARVSLAVVASIAIALGVIALERDGRAPIAWLSAISLLPLFAAIHLVVSGLNNLAMLGLDHGWWARPAWFALPLEPTWQREALSILLLASMSGALDGIAREVRAQAEGVLGSPYIEAMRLRDEPIHGTVARNMIVPIVWLAARRLPVFLGGAVVLEKVMLLPGAGAILWEAALLRDHELAMGIGLLAGVTVVTARLTSDAFATWWDPRLVWTNP